MPRHPSFHMPRQAGPLLALAMAVLLAGCNTPSRLANIGTEPPLSRIENPVERRDYRPVSLPMPRPEPVVRQANSLWRPGSRAFFKDQRASRVGDIMTVNVKVADQARVNNTTSRSRDNSENADLTSFLGIEAGALQRTFNGIDPANAIGLGSTSSSTGTGRVARQETIDLKVAALITQVLPNGNLVISGRQEVRVNFEVRELYVSGVVRPEDITSTNTISHTQIAEARIAYGGRGQLSDVQQPRYGQQLFDVLFPF